MNVYLPNLRLPSTYQEVEYIESSGTQYIVTDIRLDNTNTIELKANLSSNSNNYDKLYGGGDTNYYIFLQYEKTNGEHPNKVKATSYDGNHNIFTSNAITTGTTHVYKQSNTQFWVDDVSQGTTTATTFTMNHGLNIFALGNGVSDGRETSRYKLYYMKIYNSDSSLAYYFVPCYRKSDSVIGLYDLVNNQFYTNAGTGTFSKGNDVTMAELKNAYIGEYKGFVPGANTVAYYPLTANANDLSGNGNNGTSSGVSFSTYDGVDCAYFDGSVYTKIQLPGLGSFSEITMVIWAKTTYSLPSVSCLFMLAPSSDNKNFSIQGNNSVFILSRWNGSSAYNISDGTANDGIWHCVVATKDSSVAKLYVDGTLIGQDTRSSSVQSDSGHSAIGGHAASTNSKFIYKGYLSNSIVENKARTAQEISDYYNQTKANYGL